MLQCRCFVQLRQDLHAYSKMHGLPTLSSRIFTSSHAHLTNTAPERSPQPPSRPILLPRQSTLPGVPQGRLRGSLTYLWRSHVNVLRGLWSRLQSGAERGRRKAVPTHLLDRTLSARGDQRRLQASTRKGETLSTSRRCSQGSCQLSRPLCDLQLAQWSLGHWGYPLNASLSPGCVVSTQASC